MVNILDYRKIDLTQFNYDIPYKRDGKYISVMNYNNDYIYIQTPKLLVKDVNDSNIELSFDDTKSEQFKDLLVALDQLNIDSIIENDVSWFGQKFSPDDINNSYRSSVSFENNTLKCNLFNNDKELNTTFYDKSKTPIQLSKVKVGCQLIGIIQIIGLRISKHHIQCVWNLEQAKVYIKKPKLTGYSIVDMSDDEENNASEPDYFTDYPSASEDSYADADSEPEYIVKDEIPEETKETEYVLDEPVLDEPVLDEPVLDEPIDDEPIDDDLREILNDIEENSEIIDEPENQDIKTINVTKRKLF